MAYFIVGIELITIAFIRYKYLKTNFWLSCLQVIVAEYWFFWPVTLLAMGKI